MNVPIFGEICCLFIKSSWATGISAGNSNKTWGPFWSGVLLQARQGHVRPIWGQRQKWRRKRRPRSGQFSLHPCRWRLQSRGSSAEYLEATPTSFASVFSRLVNDHRPGRLVDLEILADLKIMVGRLQNLDWQPKLPKIRLNVGQFVKLEQVL